jgi:hypothetical protein
MKLVTLIYLEDDEKCVERLLAEIEVEGYSHLAIEGRGPGGTGGWYAAAAPYRSSLILVFLDDDRAALLLEGVRACTGVEDPRHPIRAYALSVDGAAACGC